jgi:hypothetical protein
MILETECHSLESPLQGNLHGGFGGGRGETQVGWAPCAYLTGAHRVGSASLHTDVAASRAREALPVAAHRECATRGGTRDGYRHDDAMAPRG